VKEGVGESERKRKRERERRGHRCPIRRGRRESNFVEWWFGRGSVAAGGGPAGGAPLGHSEGGGG
jgi:hypothetical protein